MARPRIELRDGGLELRMAVTLGLLAVVYAGLIAALVLSGAGAAIVAGIATVIVAVQLLTGDRLVLRVMGAREVTPEQQPELHAAVDRVCMLADMPKPRVAVASNSMPNALAVGRTRRGATLCVTSPMLRMLDPAELQGVVAHELAHIQNRDALVMTIASFLSLVAALIARFMPNVGHAAMRLITLAASLVAWALSVLLLRSLSRYRELAADRAASLITGRPSALASALMKLDGAGEGLHKKDLRAVQSVAAFCFVPPRVKGRFERLLATHPTKERRLAALDELEQRLQRSGPRA
jgi:heat shock protein HtpX